ncbi:MAG: exosortase-associated EpsI family protein [Verrucomicrobia bacterium]|nr:exosortase-associated EpsI family protein [Verrucomicrobiota bacterium]
MNPNQPGEQAETSLIMTQQHWGFGGGRVLLMGASVLLAVAVGFQFAYQLREQPQVAGRPRISASLPLRAGEWVGQDEPLGATEVVSEAALKTLNLDDYVFRLYRNGGRTFTVYAAYWAPGKMPTRLVASHTPDRCWTENGMRCVDLRFKQTYEVKGRPLLPAEYRVFVPGGTAPAGDGRNSTSEHPSQRNTRRTYVVYWHTVEGKLYDYGERFNAIPHPWLWWKDVVAQAASGSREQLFVRVASDLPLEELWPDPGVQELLESVANLGLWKGEWSGK